MSRLLGKLPTKPIDSQNWSIRFLRRVWNDLRQGFAVVANVLGLTLPATALWYLAWLLGWNVSFFKGYEQSHLGASIGFASIALFGLVMLYVPIAVCHQAATGRWKAFWDISLLRRLVWRAGWRHLTVASLFLLLSSPVMIGRIAPYFFNQDGSLDELSNEQLFDMARQYFLALSIVALPAYWLAWRLAAGIYRQQILAVPQAPENDYGDQQVVVATATTRRSWIGTLSTAAALAVAGTVWMLAAVQVFVAQFFNYVPGQGWLVHPVVVMPWLRYLPPWLLEN